MCTIAVSLTYIYGAHIQSNSKWRREVGGKRISNLRYADDTAITAENENKQEILSERANEQGKSFCMKVNIRKTITMLINKKKAKPYVKIELEGQAVEQVSKFVYLGELITDNGKYKEEIRKII